MKTFCICLPESPERLAQAKAHFELRHVKAEFFHGVCAKTFGLRTEHTYEHDHPGSGYRIPPKQVGLWLSHWTLWNIFHHSGDPGPWMVLEDDAEFDQHWAIKLCVTMERLPAGTDIFYIGSCNTSDKEKTDIGHGLYRVFYPHCTHAYVVFKSALPVLLESQRICYAPIDLALAFRSLPRLRHVTLLPRIVGQRDTLIGV